MGKILEMCFDAREADHRHVHEGIFPAQSLNVAGLFCPHCCHGVVLIVSNVLVSVGFEHLMSLAKHEDDELHPDIATALQNRGTCWKETC